MKKALLLIFIIILTLLQTTCLAKSQQKFDYVKNTTFTEAVPPTECLGVAVQYLRPLAAVNGLAEPSDSTFNIDYKGSTAPLMIVGCELQITNTTDTPASINWKECIMSTNSGDFGLPLIEGTKLQLAGAIDSTPITMIQPHKTIKLKVYFSNVKYDKKWMVKGEPLYRNLNKIISLYVPISNNGQTEKTALLTPWIYINFAA